MGGLNDFAPFTSNNGFFIVRNVTPLYKKTIKIFNYPINYNQTRDLLQIPGVSEADIRASLLKGEINHKLKVKDIIIESSDIDLLQFNKAQKLFLKNSGITVGLEITTNNMFPDFLLDNDPVTSNDIYSPTFTAGILTQEQWKNISTNNLLKQINYIYTGNLLTQEVRQVFDDNGMTIIAQITINYIYTGAALTSYNLTRDI